jgi:DNA-binding CsgD family transcriptional regulator
VDDVQWLDGSSAAALTFALRRTSAPLHVLLALRLGERSEPSPLENALSATSPERLHVGPLSAGALQSVVRQQLERVFPRPTLLRIHETSGGNPFYALEIARALPHEPDSGQPLPIPETLEGLVQARIDALSEPTRRALVLLAAMGEGDTTTFRSAGVEDALDAAIVHGIVERAGDRFRFTHPLLASSVYRDADAATRRSCHAALAVIVSNQLERARHLALSKEEPDPEIAAIVDEAADLASARGAGSMAVALRAQALRLTPADAQDSTHRRTIALIRAQLQAGAPLRSLQSMAKESLDRAVSGAQRAEALRLAGELAPDIRSAIAYRRQAIDEAQDDPRLQCRLHTELAWDIILEEGSQAAERHARACVAIADRLGDDALRGAGLIILSTIRLHQARPDALRFGEEGHELAQAEADHRERAWNTLAFTRTLIWSFQLGRARALLEQLDHEWSAYDEEITSQTLWRLACIELFAGHLDAAADLADRVEAIDRAYGVNYTGPAWLTAQVAAWRGDLERARSLVAQALENPGITPWYMPHMETVLGQVAQWSGNPELAVEHFSKAEDARATSSLEPNLARWRADHVEALIQLGRFDDAFALLESWEAEAVRLGRRVVLAQVTRCRGLVAAARGEIEVAARLLERAVAEHAAVGDPLGRARALLALGVVQRRARRRSAARSSIEGAVALFNECGARGWAERARSELGRIGGRTREEGLTPAERRVAALVAQGRTNREVAAALVLGERTVETHLTRIYEKLGVRSRTELARVYEPASRA